MSCTDVQTIQAGNGTKTQFSFDFPYIFKSEIHVYFWNATTKEWDEKLTTDATYPWQVTDANPTIVEFTSTAPPAPATPVDPGEPTVDNVRIRRVTSIADIQALFNAGSAIRSDDLNSNFEQLRYAIQEGNCEGVSDEVYQYLKNYYWDRFDNTLYSADTWRSNDATIATTAALDQRFQDEVNDTLTKAELAAASDVMPDDDVAVPTTGATKDYIDHVIETDILVDGTGLNKTGSGGQVTIGISAGSVDLDRIKADDIITYAEQPTVATSDNNIFTASAAERQFDTLVQTATPIGTNWEVGKTWLQNDANKTLSVWNGTTWLGVASGGTFTTQPTVIYVDSVNGDDANDGHRIINPKATIKAAVGDANDGDIVIVAPGVYQEVLPIDITVNNLSIVGNAQRSCFIHPTVATQENIMFRCNSGTYIDGFTFTGLKASGTRGNNAIDDDPTYGLPENQGWVASFYPNCTILKSPYINNCTSYMDSAVDNANFDPNNPAGTGGDTTSDMTGGGILVDGSVPANNSPLRSFVVNEFTQVNLDGPGLLVCNNGYAQAVSFFALFCHYHAKALTGGQVNMEVGTTDFGRYGLIADGKSGSAIFTATADGAASTSATSFLINAPSAAGNWFGTAERPANTMLVEVGGNIYPILSSTANGSGWSVVISNPNPSNRAENLGLVNGHSSGATVNFYLRSQISAAAHTFEYAGSGVNYSALPQNGGVANETNQVVQTGAAAIAGGQTEGAVFYSSTDENGKFKVGNTFQVDQKTGFVTIDPQSYSPNVVQDLTPQLGGDLDVQTHDIITSITNGDITITPNGTGNVVLDGLRYPETDGTTGQFLQTDGAGNLTFQDAITEVLEDTTPQLGGNLDLNSNNITGTGNVNITGTVTATSFTGSGSGLTGLFENVVEDTTPQLGGNLDVQTFAINTSTTNGDIDLDANASGLIKVTEFNLSQVPIVTQHDIGTAANEVPLNGYLGGMAFQDPASVSVDNLQVTNQITGNLAFANGNGIDFGATAGSGSTSSLLDDYEEGTWTPTMNYATAYGTQSGKYVKVGKTVHIWFEIQVTAWSATSASTSVGGMPFSRDAFTGCWGAIINGVSTDLDWRIGPYQAGTGGLSLWLKTSSGISLTETTFSNYTALISKLGTAFTFRGGATYISTT